MKVTRNLQQLMNATQTTEEAIMKSEEGIYNYIVGDGTHALCSN